MQTFCATISSCRPKDIICHVTILHYFLTGEILMDGLHQEIQQRNIDGQHLRPPVLAVLLETIEREFW